MKTTFRKTVLLGPVALAICMALSQVFSSRAQSYSFPGLHTFLISDHTVLLDTQPQAVALSTHSSKRVVVINTTLAQLQEGVFGNSRAENIQLFLLDSAPKALEDVLLSCLGKKE